MSDWIQHTGKGVPADAIPGVTIVRQEPFNPRAIWVDGHAPGVREQVWNGDEEVWDWVNFGKIDWRGGYQWTRVIAYRNPRQASTDAGMAMLKEILDRETIEPVKRKVTT